VTSSKPFGTFVAGFFGMGDWTATTRATALAGYPSAVSTAVLRSPSRYDHPVYGSNKVMEDPSAQLCDRMSTTSCPCAG